MQGDWKEGLQQESLMYPCLQSAWEVSFVSEAVFKEENIHKYEIKFSSLAQNNIHIHSIFIKLIISGFWLLSFIFLNSQWIFFINTKLAEFKFIEYAILAK